MSLTTTTHLNFHGRAREALQAYAAAVGGQVTIATYADFGAPADSPDADAVVWGQVATDDGFRVMAYDVPLAGRGEQPTFTTTRQHGTTRTTAPFFVSLRGAGLEELTPVWEALAEGATVVEDLAPSGWSPAFGMLTDRFGVTWVIDAAPAA